MPFEHKKNSQKHSKELKIKFAILKTLMSNRNDISLKS